MHEEIKRVRKLIADCRKELTDLEHYTEGYLSEIGQQTYGVHVVQELICEKLGITADEIKAVIEKKEALMHEQAERQKAAARAHLASVPPAEPPAEETAAETATEASDATPPSEETTPDAAPEAAQQERA